MAVNPDHLRVGLNEYRKALNDHREQLYLEQEQLQQFFDALWSVYEGSGAEDFRHRWQTTSEWFENYMEELRRLDTFL